MFLGKFFLELDKEYRVTIPERFRGFLTEDMYVTRGFDNNLWVFTSDTFREIYNKLRLLNIADPLARLLFRLILGAATEAGLNGQENLKITDDLRKYAHIDNQVLLIGQGDYFEIWSPKDWEKQEDEIKKTESNIERFSMFEITTR